MKRLRFMRRPSAGVADDDIAIVEEEKNCCCDNNLCIPSLGDCFCITERQCFPLIVLNPVILEVAFVQIMAHKGSQGVAPVTLTNR